MCFIPICGGPMSLLVLVDSPMYTQTMLGVGL